MRAPQYRRVTGKNVMPVGPNPALKKGLHVTPWANIFALVDGLGVIMPYQTEAEAQTALEHELKRRASLDSGSGLLRQATTPEADGLDVVENENAVQAINEDGGSGAE
jgi:hypothetical protein